MKAILTSPRFTSFYWRTGMMILALVVAQLASLLPALSAYVNAPTITVLGLVLGEVSKSIRDALATPDIQA